LIKTKALNCIVVVAWCSGYVTYRTNRSVLYFTCMGSWTRRSLFCALEHFVQYFVHCIHCDPCSIPTIPLGNNLG